MLRYVQALVVVLIFTPVGFAKEAARLWDTVRKADPSTLVVLDLDNTVMETPQMLGSDQWFRYLVSGYRKRGLPADRAVERALGHWSIVQMSTEMRAVERGTANLIQRLQDAGVPVMALTARPEGLMERTVAQLARIGVDFSRRPPVAANETFLSRRAISRYQKGILFGGVAVDKGQLLVEFFQKTGFKPKSVIFVDDRPENVDSVVRALKKAKIKHTGYRYGATDATVKAFDPAVAAVQYQYFRRILPDTTAKYLRMAE